MTTATRIVCLVLTAGPTFAQEAGEVGGSPAGETAVDEASGDRVPVDGGRVALQCVACHGGAGQPASPTFPTLSGQDVTYLAAQLHAFRSGARFHPVMSPIAQALADAEIDAVATFYGDLDPLPRIDATQGDDEDQQ